MLASAEEGGAVADWEDWFPLFPGEAPPQLRMVHTHLFTKILIQEQDFY